MNTIAQLEHICAKQVYDKTRYLVEKQIPIGLDSLDGSKRLESNCFAITCQVPHVYHQGDYVEPFLDKVNPRSLVKKLDKLLEPHGVSVKYALRCHDFYLDYRDLNMRKSSRLMQELPELEVCLSIWTCCVYLYMKHFYYASYRKKKLRETTTASYICVFRTTPLD